MNRMTSVCVIFAICFTACIFLVTALTNYQEPMQPERTEPKRLLMCLLVGMQVTKNYNNNENAFDYKVISSHSFLFCLCVVWYGSYSTSHSSCYINSTQQSHLEPQERKRKSQESFQCRCAWLCHGYL